MRSHSAMTAFSVLSPDLEYLRARSRRCSTDWMSRSTSSVMITSMSSRGLTLPDTCTTFSSSKQRTTFKMASHSRMLLKNWLPSPSPLLAPSTSPAMSTNSMAVGTTDLGLMVCTSASWRGSGTGTTPTLGSMVQKG